jgi:predicted HicB family RNase H-like nuclease
MPKRKLESLPSQEGKASAVANHYTYRVSWSEEDGEFVAICAEFPSLSNLASHPVQALVGIQELVSGVLLDMGENGEEIPIPFGAKEYSGHFMTRIPGELHRRLVIEAAEEGVSLNRLVSNKLAMSNTVTVKPAAPVAVARTKRRQMADA